MAEEKSFEDLVKEAPAGGTVSLVGALAQSSEAGKFMLTLQDGRALTLAMTSVKGHAVLGSSVGQTIVRIDVDAGSLPAGAPGVPLAVDIYTPPPVDYTLASRDIGNKPVLDHTLPWVEHAFPFGISPGPTGAALPFALATPHQVPPETLAALGQAFPAFAKHAFFDRTGADIDKPPFQDGTVGRHVDF
jgi:hypothetical protein